MADNTTAPVTNNQSAPVSDEVSVITEGTIIKGDIVSNGSLDVRGQVEGNVGCNGKLVVTGVVNGNSSASEFFADAAKIEGEVVSTGTIKIGLGSVIIGNVTSTSAVIAGAIKGDIDVQGPVVVDTSAVVMGNIKSRSVQINNGAVIEGFCSQCYADVDVEKLFQQIYFQVTGQNSSGFTPLEIAYSAGLGLGILFFFNHFGHRKITADPTPMQVQMRKYEDDVNTTITENIFPVHK